MQLKEKYKQLYKILIKNEQKKIADVLPEIDKIAIKKYTRDKNYIATDSGKLLAIFDTYAKKWVVLVGKYKVKIYRKNRSVTGYSSFCTESMKMYQRKRAKIKVFISRAMVLEDSAKGELLKKVAQERKRKIELPREIKSWDTLKECKKYLIQLSDKEIAEAPKIKKVEKKNLTKEKKTLQYK